jgi:CBS domain containing-hemolysin-like protein
VLHPGATLGAAADLARSSHHMKVPVMSEDGARCVGVLNVRDVLSCVTDKPDAPVLPHVRTPFYIKADVRADDVLPLLRRARRRLALVRDRSGKILGIITVAGILRFIVGRLPAQAR